MGASPAKTESSALQDEAKSLADIGEFDKARDAIKRALETAPNSSELHAVMSWYTFRSRQLDDSERERLAEHHLAVAREIGGADDAHAHHYEGLIWRDRGNLPRASASLQAALRVDPGRRAAKEVLDKLGLQPIGPAQPAAPVPSGKPAGKRRVVRGPIAVATVAAVLLGVGGYFFLTADERELASLGKQLGTKLPIQSAGRSGKEMHILVGGWETLSAEERGSELKTISDGALNMGFSHVFVHRENAVVAEAKEGKICADGPCTPAPAVQIGADGVASAKAPAVEQKK
jgi:tetratricopeptide (TPR) repeat protein